MAPSIREQSIVDVRASRLRPPGLGEVVLVDLGTCLKLHRLTQVWRVGATWWAQTRSDAGEADAPVPLEKVLGVVEWVDGRRVDAAPGRVRRTLSRAARALGVWP